MELGPLGIAERVGRGGGDTGDRREGCAVERTLGIIGVGYGGRGPWGSFEGVVCVGVRTLGGRGRRIQGVKSLGIVGRGVLWKGPWGVLGVGYGG